MSSFTDIFSGSVISPALESFIQYSLTALIPQITLYFPSQFVNTANYTANIIQVTASTTGCSLVMPDATQVSVGQASLFVNNGSNTVTIYANDGVTNLITLTAAQSNYLYLTDNSTANGSWRSILFGSGSVSPVISVGITSASPTELIVSGSPITSSGTITLTLGADLLALTTLGSSTGIITKTGTSAYTARTITGTSNQIVVTNGSGISGNPTIALAANVSGLTSLTAGNLAIGVSSTNTISTTDGNPINFPQFVAILPNTGVASYLEFYENSGVHSLGLKAPAVVAANVNWTLPGTDGAIGQVLTTDGSGILSWSSTGAGTVNSVAGTVNRITSTGGTNPVIDISAAYVGQTSITTLGAIGTGTWQATPVVVQFGGTGAATFNAYGVLCGGTTNTGIVQSIAAVAAGQVLTSTGTGSLPAWQTIVAKSWVDAATNTVMVVGTAYLADSASQLTFTIPATCAKFAQFQVSGWGTGGFILQANTSQTIQFGNQVTSSAGSITSSNQFDDITIVCTVANTSFKVIDGPIGNLVVA